CPELARELTERPPLRGLEGLEPPAAVARLGRGQRRQRTEKPVLPVPRHLLGGQGLSHGGSAEAHAAWATPPPATVASSSTSPRPKAGMWLCASWKPGTTVRPWRLATRSASR